MTHEQKQKVVSCHIMSVYRYGIAQYLGETVEVKNRLIVAMMNSMRSLRGYRRGQMSNEKVLTNLGQNEPEQQILRESVKFIHGIMHRKKPTGLYDLIKLPTWREFWDIGPEHFPQKMKFQTFMRCNS